MVCSTSLALALGLMGASIATTMSARSFALQSKFAQSLDPEQLEIYRSIINHRLTLYLQGFVIGLLSGVLYVSVVGSAKPSAMVMGTFTLIVLGVQYMYYVLMPKPKWMLDHLQPSAAAKEPLYSSQDGVCAVTAERLLKGVQDQTTAWLDVYRYMSMRWHAGLALGVLGSLAGCYGCLKK